jgi:hypothetical protein
MFPGTEGDLRGWRVSSQVERCAKDDGGGGGAPGETGYDAYRTARERFFATLRAESDLRRLERLWALDGLEPGERPGGG